MKKSIKIISILLLVAMMIVTFTGIVNAAGASDVLNDLQKPADNVNSTEITNLGKNIVAIVQVVGVVIAVVVILVIGIKYLIGSAEEKAEYKKTMIPYLVGAVLVFAGATIVNVVYNVVTGLNS